MELIERKIRVLCPKKQLLSKCRPNQVACIQWLIGSPLFLPQFTIVSSLRCLHFIGNSTDPDFRKEADDIRSLLIRGFDIIGALYIGSGLWEEKAKKAVNYSCQLRKHLFDEESCDMIGGASDLNGMDIKFGSGSSKSTKLEVLNSVVYEEVSEEYLWEKGCLLRCVMSCNLPVYVPFNKRSDSEEIFSMVTTGAIARLKDPHIAYVIEGGNISSQESCPTSILHGEELFNTSLCDKNGFGNSIKSNENTVACSFFCSKHKLIPSSTFGQNADAIQVTVLSNQSRSNVTSTAPTAQYLPASDPVRVLIVSFKLDVLCYASKDSPISFAISQLVVPGLADQINCMKNSFKLKLLEQHPQLSSYHFIPPGYLHPVTAIYDHQYGETEVAQVEIRKSLHERLMLPLDRPLLRIANALSFGNNSSSSSSLKCNASTLLKDVHTDIPSSGVSGGHISLIDGSYEYYHYLLDGIDDNGWGCAYRSLQTIISWFRLQHYTSIKVPSHREVQQALVEIGDKEPAFIGSRDWIGAIELSFVLDKLLGISCKIMNVRSGSELPEKCRELALHFETQGTPIMIGGGVLAYTLLGVDYNDASGDCAFLILDPHYTGNDDLKKIVNGGWCGWKKAVDSKGRNFFLRDKFYNLLLPQRPNMV